MRLNNHRGIKMPSRIIAMILLLISASLRAETKPNFIVILADDLGYGALLTGRDPTRTGVTGVIGANTKRHLPLKEITFAERLKTMGYDTAIFGKWHPGNTPDA